MADGDGVVPLVTRRVGILRAVAGGATDRGSVTEAVDVSRSTVDRGVRELVDADLVAWSDDGLALTLAGRLALEAHDEMRSRLDAVARARDLLAPLPPDTDLPVEVLLDAALEVGPDDDPAAPVRELVEGATALRGYRTRRVESTPGLVDLVSETVEEADLCLSPGLVETLVAEERDRLQGLLDADGVSIRELDGDPEFDLLLVERGDGTTTGVAVLVHDDGGLRGTILTHHPDAVAWGRGAVDREWADATTLDGA